MFITNIKILQFIKYYYMGKIYPDLAGAYLGAVGGATYYMLHSNNVVRRKGIPGKASNSPEAVEQRLKFAMLIMLSSALRSAIRLGFPQRKRGWSAANAFLSLNKDICSVEAENVVTVDYERLFCANGSLLVPDVTASYNSETQKFIFEQTPTEEEVDNNADDAVYAVLLESVLGFCRVVTLRQRGESGSTSVPLPQKWNKENVKIYTFAVSADKKKASKSQYLTLEEGA